MGSLIPELKLNMIMPTTATVSMQSYFSPAGSIVFVCFRRTIQRITEKNRDRSQVSQGVVIMQGWHDFRDSHVGILATLVDPSIAT